MSETINIPRDTTLQEVADNIKTQNGLMQILVAESMAAVATDMQAIKHIVQNGYAESVFSVGDQIVYDWADAVSEAVYSVPHNVVTFQDVEIADGEILPGMWLQWNYASLYAIPFDDREAFYCTEEGLEAGTYYITIGSTWGDYLTNGMIFEFTLENAVPAGGQLYFASNIYSASGDGTNVYVYESASAKEVAETATMNAVESSEGTDLGTITTTLKYADYGLNNLVRAVYGYNRWSQSAIRQYLNSSAGIGEWWKPQNNFDRPPAQLDTYPGFLSGYDSAFLSAIQAVKVTTALNTISDSEIGTSEDTYDKVFLPSLEQLYISPQLSGAEGTYWEYWKRATGAASPITRSNAAGTFPITYAINNTALAQGVRLRSAYRGTAYGAWYVNSSGGINGSGASAAYRFAPACVIC